MPTHFTAGHPRHGRAPAWLTSERSPGITGRGDTPSRGPLSSMVSPGLSPKLSCPPPTSSPGLHCLLHVSPTFSKVSGFSVLPLRAPFPARASSPSTVGPRSAHLLIRAPFGTARGHVAPVGVIGGVLAHLMVGITGGEDVQLPTVLPAALTHRLGGDGRLGGPRSSFQQGHSGEG